MEPISFLKFQGTLIAVTATEAALYDEMLSGGLRAVLPTVAFSESTTFYVFGNTGSGISGLGRSYIRESVQQ